MYNRFLKVCCFLAACVFTTICSASMREDAMSGADTSRRKLRIVRPTDSDALQAKYRVRIGKSEHHLRIIERDMTEDDELDGSLSEEERASHASEVLSVVSTIPDLRVTEWRNHSHQEKFDVRIFRGGVGELHFTEDGYGVQPVFLLKQYAFTSASFYLKKRKHGRDTGDLIAKSLKLAKKIFPCVHPDMEGFISRHLVLCPEDMNYSEFYPPFLTLPRDRFSSCVDALYFLHTGFGRNGTHEFTQFLASCTRNIQTQTYVYLLKNGRQFESCKKLNSFDCAEQGIKGPIKVIISYPLTRPLPALAVQENNYMIFGSKEIRVVLEQSASGVRMDVLPSLWDPSTNRQLFEVDEFSEFCKNRRTSLRH